jgi:uncharacterized protein YggE
MEKQLTMSVKGLLVSGLVLLGLVVAYLLGNAGTTTAEAAEENAATPPARTLTMSGFGQATAVPDEVTFDLSVRLLRPTLEEALDASNEEMAGVLKALEDAGVQRKDVQTTGLEMNPDYTYPDDSPPVLRGYRVSQQAAVLVRELKEAGRAVNAAVVAGGNVVRVENIQLKIGDPEAALATAREEAVAKATAKAEEYAAATGQELGDVLTLSEVQDQAQSGIDDRDLLQRSAAYAVDAAKLSDMVVSAGRADLGVVIQVVWEFA